MSRCVPKWKRIICLRNESSRALLSIALMISTIFTSYEVEAHGGTPRVLKVVPPKSSNDSLWVIDTLGAFRTTIDHQEVSSNYQWAWLCDDAVDPTLGVDDLSILDQDILIAIAKSGLYRSEDGGCEFERIDSEVNQYALGQLSAMPSDMSHLALYTDSVGQDNSVWWSHDAGVTWSISNLTIEGSIYAMWRDPKNEEELWVNHARGLSFSDDGGQTFTSVNPSGYGLEASDSEARLLGGGYLGDHLALFVGINRFPLASLVISLDRGQTWRVILELEDSFESLLLTHDSLWVSTPFEGLSRYIIGNAERETSDMAWRSNWQRDPDLFIGCLREDPLIAGKVWSCGRSDPSGWIAAYTEPLSAAEISWQVVMNDYSEASEGDWGCLSDSQSTIACESRCLTSDCDPSGREMSLVDESESTSNANRQDNLNDEESDSSIEDRSTSQGCAQRDQSHLRIHRRSLPPLLLPLFLLLTLTSRRYRDE